MEEKTIPLSTAIRMGSMLKPQIIGGYANDDGTCAYGAAYQAMGYERVCFGTPPEEQLWPITRVISQMACPECGRTGRDPIIHLNDFHEWTRERIADWVESLENQSPAGEKANLKVEEVGEAVSSGAVKL